MVQPSQTSIRAARRSGNPGFPGDASNGQSPLSRLHHRPNWEPRKTCLSFIVALHSIDWMRHRVGGICREERSCLAGCSGCRGIPKQDFWGRDLLRPLRNPVGTNLKVNPSKSNVESAIHLPTPLEREELHALWDTCIQ
jgi:hypothetical protein